MKQAIFLIVDHGMEGRGPESIQFAFTDETERDQFYNEHQNKPYYSKVDRVVDLEAHRAEALKKLNGLDKLALDLQEPEPFGRVLAELRVPTNNYHKVKKN